MLGVWLCRCEGYHAQTLLGVVTTPGSIAARGDTDVGGVLELKYLDHHMWCCMYILKTQTV